MRTLAIYTKLLAEGVLPANVLTVVYTAPDVGTLVLRDIVLTVAYGTSSAFMGVKVGPPGGSTIWLCSYANVTSWQTSHWDGRQVIAPGHQVSVFNSTQLMSYRLTGYHLV